MFEEMTCKFALFFWIVLLGYYEVTVPVPDTGLRSTVIRYITFIGTHSSDARRSLNYVMLT